MMVKLRIIPLISIIALLLFLVPLSIFLENIIAAKIFGVLCLICVMLALKFWFTALRKGARKSEIIRLNTNDKFNLNKVFPFIKNWSDSEINILFSRIGSMMAEVELSSEDGLMERNEALNLSFVLGIYFYDCDFLPLSGKKITITKNYFNQIIEEVNANEKKMSSLNSAFNLMKSNALVNGFINHL